MPPDQFPAAVWEELARQGKLKRAGGGITRSDSRRTEKDEHSQRSRAPWLFAFFVLWGVPVLAKDGPPNDSRRWDNEIQAFEKADKAKLPPSVVLFIGSSTIVRPWTTLAEDFPEHKVINRGFGGFPQIADSVFYADRIVIPYKPRLIVLRAGGNDINAGKTPERVFDDFKAFVKEVRRCRIRGLPI